VHAVAATKLLEDRRESVNVRHRLPVDGDDPVAGAESRALGGRAGRHPPDDRAGVAARRRDARVPVGPAAERALGRCLIGGELGGLREQGERKGEAEGEHDRALQRSLL